MLHNLYNIIHNITVTYKGGLAITDILLWTYVLSHIGCDIGKKIIFKER